VKNYNPVKINPAIPVKEMIPKMRREYDLLDDIKDKTTRSVENNVKTLLKPKVKPYVNIDESKKQLNEEIEKAKNKKLKSTSIKKPHIAKNGPTPLENDLPDLPDDDVIENYKKKLAEFENDLQEGKSKLKTRSQRTREVRESLLNKIEKQNKEIANHEKVALITIDDIITELEGLTTKTLTAKKRKEVNEKLKEVDGSNIGAIKNVDKAIERLQSKKETINKSKELIEQRKKETSEADRKISRSVPKNQNIVNVANFPANDDNSDFSVKKVIKSNPVISKLKTPAKAPGKK
jgi:prefoldin subunit 5